MLCEHAYDLPDPPPVEVVVEGAGPGAAGAGPVAACAPMHATYALVELLKNALVATVERHRDAHGDDALEDGVDDLAPVVVRLAETDAGVRVAIVDEGGGIDAPTLAACLGLRPSLSQRYDRLDEPGGSYNSGSQKPISGVGMGLPMSRLFAAHLGGTLTLASNHGPPFGEGVGPRFSTTATFVLPAPTALSTRESLPPPPEEDMSWARR